MYIQTYTLYVHMYIQTYTLYVHMYTQTYTLYVHMYTQTYILRSLITGIYVLSIPHPALQNIDHAYLHIRTYVHILLQCQHLRNIAALSRAAGSGFLSTKNGHDGGL